MQDIRLTSHGQRFVFGQILIDRTDLFRYMRKSFAEEFESSFFHCLKVLLCLFGSIPGVVKFTLGIFEAFLHHAETLHRSHVWSHVL